MEVIHERCAGMDISKRDAKVCLRAPGARPGIYGKRITVHGAMHRDIAELRDHLLAQQVTLVVLEATGDYWKPFYYGLEDVLNVMLVNARHAKNLPGRKTDLLTELSAGSWGGCVRHRVRLVSFTACDQRWGCAAGVVRAGGAAAGLSRGDGGSVRAVSAR